MFSLSLSTSLLLARAREENTIGRMGERESPLEDTSMEVVAIQLVHGDFLEDERGGEGEEEGRGYTARRNPAVTHGRIELFIVMAACSTRRRRCCV